MQHLLCARRSFVHCVYLFIWTSPNAKVAITVVILILRREKRKLRKVNLPTTFWTHFIWDFSFYLAFPDLHKLGTGRAGVTSGWGEGEHLFSDGETEIEKPSDLLRPCSQEQADPWLLIGSVSGYEMFSFGVYLVQRNQYRSLLQVARPSHPGAWGPGILLCAKFREDVGEKREPLCSVRNPPPHLALSSHLPSFVCCDRDVCVDRVVGGLAVFVVGLAQPQRWILGGTGPVEGVWEEAPSAT